VPETLLQTKLYIPPLRPNLVPRPQLIERLNQGLQQDCKLTLVSAPAGFGKSTLLSAWVRQAELHRRVAWLSLDEGDNDLTRFLTYFIVALQTAESNVGQGLLAALQSPGAVNVEIVLTALLNEITEFPREVVFILDDYHVLESQPIDKAITFLIDHLPPQMHLVIAGRIDPSLPLSRLRAGCQMTEIRVDDLRFTSDEAEVLLNQVMDFELSAQEIAALETRTEGWIAGLQLAALSMRDLKGSTKIIDFINNFTGSNRYIQDYLVDEVLQQQPRVTNDFLLQTSILSRLSALLCDAVTENNNSQTILESLETANLFIVPLDNDRLWYRYHHLFADLLRQRLHQQQPDLVDELHIRASAWYENNDLEIEALRHAAAANDFERAARLVEGEGAPLYLRGEMMPILNWLESLPKSQLDDRPSLWVIYAGVLQAVGRFASLEEVFQAAEAALQKNETDAAARNPLGAIASLRATLLLSQHEIESGIAEARRALDLARPNSFVIRAAATWALGRGYRMRGDRVLAGQAFAEALEISQATKSTMLSLLAITGLGHIEAAENRLHQAAQTYQRALQLAGEYPQPVAADTYLGLARVFYEWNDLVAAQRQGEKGLQLARQKEMNDQPIAHEAFLARLKLAQGDVAGAAAIVERANQSIRQHNFIHRIPEVAAIQVLVLLRQGDVKAAANLTHEHDLPVSQARVYLAQGETSTALEMLDSLREQMEAKDWKDEILRIMVLQGVALHKHGEPDQAVRLLGEALDMAEPGGFIRTFVDEGTSMAELLYEAAARGILPVYTSKLLSAAEAEKHPDTITPFQPLVEPLSPRELEVLQLIAKGLSNREISERLFLAVDTVKGHNHRIYGKLGVNNRTQAVNKAVTLKIIPPQ
jgi:LuxR family maltose regulon positive regulatory protein